jgi:hypothetical protein
MLNKSRPGSAVIFLLGLTFAPFLPSKAEEPKLGTATIAVVLGEKGPVAIFSFTNTSGKELRVGEASTIDSPVTVVKPDGTSVQLAQYGDYSDPLGPPAVKAGDTHWMKWNVVYLFRTLKLSQDGVYRLSWAVTPRGEKATVQSNELLVVRDEWFKEGKPATGNGNAK